MSITWGDWEYSGGNGMRVGIEVVWATPTHATTSLDADVFVYTENQHSYNDDQKLTYGGKISGSHSFTNNDGTSQIQRDNVDYNYDYGASEYGGTSVKVTFSASLSGAYNGVTPSVSVSSSVPVRPFAAPAAPTSVALARASDTSAVTSWVRHATAGEPYDNQGIQRSTNGGAFATLSLVVAGTATTYNDTSVVANAKYRYQVRAQNSIGVSTFVQSNDVWTTPAVPTSVARSGLNGANQVITWANNVGYPVNTEWQTEVWRSDDNAAYALLTTVAGSLATYTDTYPATHAAVKFKYILRSKTTNGAVLYSAWSAETTQTSGTTTPPAAPTNLSPNGIVVDPSVVGGTILTWTFVPGQVGDTQTQYQIRRRLNGSPTWTTDAIQTTSLSQGSIPVNTYADGSIVEWQVSTKGSDPAFSQFSNSAIYTNTITVITPPPVIYPADVDIRTGLVRANSAFNEVRDFLMRTQSQLFGGGTRSVDGSFNITWSSRFITICLGAGPNTANVGYFDIKPPASVTVTNKQANGSQAILTFTGTNKFRVGETIIVSGVDATFNGTYVVRAVTTNTVSYDKVATVTSVASGGSIGHRIQGHGGAANQVASTTSLIPLATTWVALYYEMPMGWGSGTTPRKNGVVTVTNKSLTTNVATLTVLPPHYFAIGEPIVVSIGDASFDGQYTITAMTANTITYARTNADVASAPVPSGIAAPFGSDTLMGNYHVVNYTAAFTVPSNWILIAMRNGDTGQVEWASGESLAAGGSSGTLSALSAFNTNGLVTQTAQGVFAGRSIAVDATMKTVVNPAGTAGNPTVGVADTGAQTAGFTAAANWTLNTVSYHILAGVLCHLHIQATYTSATTITGPANGNIANVAVASVIPAACRPNRDMRFMYSVGSAYGGTAAVTASGTMQIESIVPTATIDNTTNNVITFDAVYALLS